MSERIGFKIAEEMEMEALDSRFNGRHVVIENN